MDPAILSASAPSGAGSPVCRCQKQYLTSELASSPNVRYGESLSISNPPTSAYDYGKGKETDPVETTEGIVVPMVPVGDAGLNGGGNRMDMCRFEGMDLRDPKDALHNIGGGMNKRDIFGGVLRMSPEAWNYRHCHDPANPNCK